jgi:tRNA nucleotidyltransferase/poly(A) polymerase
MRRTFYFQVEGYKILKSINPIRALSLLNEIQILSNFHVNREYIDLCDLKNSYGPHFKLCILANITDKTVIDEFVQLFHFTSKVVKQYNDLFQSCKNNIYENNSIKSQIKVLKKVLEK